MSGIEVCANSFTSALAAEKGGAIRVELCENMAEGGTTPSYGQIKLCKDRLQLAVWPIIRPRGGDFLYTDAEFELMKLDILACKDLNCDGVVTGILLSNGEIDKDRCRELVQLAHPMPVAFHRAFDRCNNLSLALETLIDIGFVRILTSGAAENALDGSETIAKLIKQANNRIALMPGAGINPGNILEIKERTGAQTFHASARVQIESKMEFKNPLTGAKGDQYAIEQTSAVIVKQLVEAIR